MMRSGGAGRDGISSSPSVASRLSRRLDATLTRFFYLLGFFVASRPVLTAVSTSTACVLLGTGLVKTRVESDDEFLYSPRHSPEAERLEWAARTFVKEHEESRGSTKGVVVVAVSADSSRKNLVDDRTALLHLFDVLDEVVALAGDPEWCGLNGLDQPIVLAATGRWNSSAALARDEGWRVTVLTAPYLGYQDVHARTSVTDAGPPEIFITPIETVVGGMTIEGDTDPPYDPLPRLISAKALAAKVVLKGDIPLSRMRKIDALVQRRSNARLDLYVHSKTSYRDAVMASIVHDGRLVLLSILLLLGFATFCFFTGARCSSSRRRLFYGPLAMLSVILSLLAAFGAWMILGGYFHALMGAAIFMVLGLGVDDAFVIVAALDEGEPSGGLPRVVARVARAMEQAGVSILLTSVTDAAAFGACALATSIPALQSFCAVAALSIALDFFMQATFFVALLSMLQPSPPGGFSVVLPQPPPSQPPSVEEEAYDPPVIGAYSSALLGRTGRSLVLTASLGLLLMGGYGAYKLEINFDTTWMMPSGSQVAMATSIEARYFQAASSWLLPCYTRGEVNPRYLASYRDAISNLAADPELNSSPEVEQRLWLDSVAYNATTTPAEFSRRALEQARGSKWMAKHLAFRDDTGTCATLAGLAGGAPLSLCATQSTFKFKSTRDSGEKMRMLRQGQATIDKFKGARKLGTFLPSTPSLAALKSTRPQTVQSLKYVLLVVFACCLVLMGDFFAAALMLAVMAGVDLVLVGSLYWIGESMNMVTTVIMTLAIGLACDFSAHVAHAYLRAREADDKVSSVKKALRRMATPVLQGGLSTLVAILPMALSLSYVIRLFFIMCFAIVLTGLFAGLCTVPVVLSLTCAAPPEEDALFYTALSPLSAADDEVLGGVLELGRTTTTDTNKTRRQNDGDAPVLLPGEDEPPR